MYTLSPCQMCVFFSKLILGDWTYAEHYMKYLDYYCYCLGFDAK